MRNINISPITGKITLFICFVFILIYLVLRIFNVGMTIDESASALFAIDCTYKQIYEFAGLSSNNHFLNTVLIKTFVLWFGNYPSIIRLPNLLSFCVFSIYLYKFILQLTKEPIFIIFAFLLISFNPYFLDWFSIGRGYGLSYGFMMAGIYYLFKFGDSMKLLYLHLLLISLIFCVISSFVMLTFYVTIILCLGTVIIFQFGVNNYIKTLKIFSISIVYTVLLIAFIFNPIKELRQNEQFYFGGYNGFWQDTALSVIRHLKYNGWNIGETSVLLFILILMMTLIVFVIYQLIKNQRKINNNLIFSMCLLIFPSLITVIQHYYLGTPYLIQRTALFLFILFMISMVIFVLFLSSNIKYRNFIEMGFLVSFLILCIHFIKTGNIYKTMDWNTDIDNTELFEPFIKFVNDNNIKEPLVLNVSNVNFYSIDYYNRKQSNPFLINLRCRGIVDTTGFYYLTEQGFNLQTKRNFKIIKVFPRSKNVLLYCP